MVIAPITDSRNLKLVELVESSFLATNGVQLDSIRELFEPYKITLFYAPKGNGFGFELQKQSESHAVLRPLRGRLDGARIEDAFSLATPKGVSVMADGYTMDILYGDDSMPSLDGSQKVDLRKRLGSESRFLDFSAPKGNSGGLSFVEDFLGVFRNQDVSLYVPNENEQLHLHHDGGIEFSLSGKIMAASNVGSRTVALRNNVTIVSTNQPSYSATLEIKFAK